MLFRLINLFKDFWYLGLGYFLASSYLILLNHYLKNRFSARIKLVWGNLFIFLLLLFNVFFVLEVYFRYIYDQTDSYQALLTSHRWFKRHVYDKGQLTQPFALNKPVQFRDLRDLRQPKPAGVRRIAVVGDSIAYGYGIKNITDRYSNLLEISLRDDGFSVEVYNLSLPGADIPQEEEFFELSSSEGDIDLIIWGFYLNDILTDKPELISEFKDRTLRYRQNPLFNDLIGRSFAVNFFYVRSSLFWSHTLEDYLMSYLRLYEDDQTWGEAQQSIRQVINGLKQKKKPVAVVIFPLMNLIGPDYPGEVAHQRLNELFAREKVPAVDLLPVYNQYLPKELMVNRYDAHPNELGHRLAAEKLHQLLTESFAKILQ